jgi:integrase
VKCLVPEQTERLLAACERHSLPLWAIVQLAAHTGMGQGERLGLTWANVDLAAKTQADQDQE